MNFVLFRRHFILFAETDMLNRQMEHVNTTSHSDLNTQYVTTSNSMWQFFILTMIYLATILIFISKLLPQLKRSIRAIALSLEFQNAWFITRGLTKQSLIDPDMSVEEFENELKCKNVELREGMPHQWRSFTRVYREAEERYILATKSKFLERALAESFSKPFNHILKKQVNEKRAKYLMDEIRIDSLEVNHFAWLKKNSILIISINVTGKEYEYRKVEEQHLYELEQWQDYIVLAKDVRNEQWKIINLIQEGRFIKN